MSQPKVWNLRDPACPTTVVRIDRRTFYGNPFRIGFDGNRETVIRKYREWVVGQPTILAAIRQNLCGKDLGCHCAPEACHGDVILEIANATI